MNGAEKNGSQSDIKTSPSRGQVTTSPSKPRLISQSSSASLRQRGGNPPMSGGRRNSSLYQLPHMDSAHFETVAGPSLDDIDLNEVPWWTSHRLRLAILCFLGFAGLYAQRVNLSIAIVTMIDHSDQYETDDPTNTTLNNTTQDPGYSVITTTGYYDTTTEESGPKCTKLSKSATKGEFHWNKELEGLILGAFFWGYLVFQVPGGRLSEKFGATRVIGYAMFPVSILGLLSPIAARTSPYLFLFVRVLIGLCEGVMYPAAQALWARWAPPNERSRLIGVSYAGGQAGNALIFPVGGLLCAYGFDGGWPSVFYIIGMLGFLWCCLWMWLAHDSPDDDKTITDIEKKYIQASIGLRANSSKSSIPWKAMLTSPAVWAIIISHMCGNYGIYMLLTKLPAYMKEVLYFDIKSNGVFSMLPYLTFWTLITIGSMIADTLITKGIMSIGATRKLMSVIGMVGPAVFLIGTGFMECDQQAAAVVLLTLAVGMCGFHFSGFFINHGDIAPPYAGTLFGITNTAATIPGILSPYVVSAMTKQGTRQQWQNTFYVAAAIYCFGAVWYLIFGKGEIQPWAKVVSSPSGFPDKKYDRNGSVGFDLLEIHEEHEEHGEHEEDDPRLLPSVSANSDGKGGNPEATPLKEDV